MPSDRKPSVILPLVVAMPVDERLAFYELFSLQLTGEIRCVLGDPAASEREKVRRADAINEILHRAVAKAHAMRLKTNEWTEDSFWEMVAAFVGRDPDQVLSPIVERAAREAIRLASAATA